jgi:hypothetical protein
MPKFGIPVNIWGRGATALDDAASAITEASTLTGTSVKTVFDDAATAYMTAIRPLSTVDGTYYTAQSGGSTAYQTAQGGSSAASAMSSVPASYPGAQTVYDKYGKLIDVVVGVATVAGGGAAAGATAVAIDDAGEGSGTVDGSMSTTNVTGDTSNVTVVTDPGGYQDPETGEWVQNGSTATGAGTAAGTTTGTTNNPGNIATTCVKPLDCYQRCQEQDKAKELLCKQMNKDWAEKMKSIGCGTTSCTSASTRKSCSKASTSKAKYPKPCGCK